MINKDGAILIAIILLCCNQSSAPLLFRNISANINDSITNKMYLIYFDISATHEQSTNGKCLPRITRLGVSAFLLTRTRYRLTISTQGIAWDIT